MTDKSNLKYAVLIDAENAQAKNIESILSHIEKHGALIVKRIYGDFSVQNTTCWKATIQKHSLKPIQQFQNTNYKNATDMMLIIDAMDMLHSKMFDGFCIISSDSDFTSLATRLREDGKYVWGFGERKTPDSFVNACNKFTFVDDILGLKAKPTNHGVQINTKKTKQKVLKKSQLIEAFNYAALENGWVSLSAFGHALRYVVPNFKLKDYGYRTLSHYLNANMHYFTLKETPSENDKPNEIYFKVIS
jgi:uncharacterized LabA/DUF88 family protein